MKPAGDEVEFSVRDAGRGFSTEQIQRIGAYVQFERKMQDEQGLGLGLAIAKKLVELHGGTLAMESGQGAGATVIVRLPKAKDVLNRFQNGSRGVKQGVKPASRASSAARKTSTMPTTGAKSTCPSRSGIFLSGATFLRGRVHIIPERMPAEINVAVQQMQHSSAPAGNFQTR